MPKVNYSSESPYRYTDQTSWYLGNYVHRYIPSHGTDMTVMILDKYHERPDLMAYDIYGSPKYWWVFMVRNMNLIMDPIYDHKSGLIIYVPTKERILNIVG